MAKANKPAKNAKPAVADSADAKASVKAAAKSDKPVKAAKAQIKAVKPSKPNVFTRLSRYFSDVRAEMKRVVWPSRQEVINSSGIVITTLIIFIIMIAVFDYVSVTVVRALQNLGG
jgi:preprotein translocase subunit SecE